eukprot:gene30309-36623_t
MWKFYGFWLTLFSLTGSYLSQPPLDDHQHPVHRRHHIQACRLPPPGACNSTVKILPDGRWCLEVEPNKFIAPGRPLARHHIVADEGIARVIAEIVPSTDSLIDIGAGIGQYQVWFMNNHKTFRKYLAFDGAPNVEEFTFGIVRYLNIAQYVHWHAHEVSDWTLSLEVGEHLDKQYESVFIQNLHRANTKGIILSWGIPGQGGNGHVNEQPNDYIKSIICNLGYEYDARLSDKGRSEAKYFWFRNTFMVFHRKAL